MSSLGIDIMYLNYIIICKNIIANILAMTAQDFVSTPSIIEDSMYFANSALPEASILKICC